MKSRVEWFAVPLTLQVAALQKVRGQTHRQTDSQTHADNPVSYYGIFAENRKCAFGAKTPSISGLHFSSSGKKYKVKSPSKKANSLYNRLETCL